MNLSIRQILKATGGSLVSGYPTSLTSGISIDTRTLRPGDIFFALRGPRFDGHAFMKAAVEKKAGAIVCEQVPSDFHVSDDVLPELIQVKDALRALQDTARRLRAETTQTTVIGLTGSNGKTTTKQMLASILSRAGKTLSTRGNLNNHIGLPLMLCDLAADDKYAVLELGTSKVGDMDLLVDLARPQVGVITNVGKDHLEFLESPEGVLKENRKLYDALPKDGVAILNLDDPYLKGLKGHLPCRTVTYGQNAQADVSVDDIVSASATTRFLLRLGKEYYPVTLQAIGEMQVLNAMAAAATAYALGIKPPEIVAGLTNFVPAAMRMDVRQMSQGATLINDAYNANPSSMQVSIESFCKSFPDRPRWVVLGDMRELGKISRQEHESLGRWLAMFPLDRVYLYGRETRHIKTGLQAENFKGVVERYKKKRYLIESLKRSLSAPGQPVILFKASRRLALEQVIHALLAV